MAKAAKKAVKKATKAARPQTYDKSLTTFDGTFDDMINISLTGAGAKKSAITKNISKK